MAAEVFAPKKPASEKLPTIVMSHGWGGTCRSLAARCDRLRTSRLSGRRIRLSRLGQERLAADSRRREARESKDGKLVAEVKEVREVVDPDRPDDRHPQRHSLGCQRQAVRSRANWHLGFVVFGWACRLRRSPRSAREGLCQPGRLDGRPLGDREPADAPITSSQGAARTRGTIGYPKPGEKFGTLTGAPVLEKFIGYAPIEDIGRCESLRQAVHHRRERRAVRQQGPRDSGSRTSDRRQETGHHPRHQALRHLQRSPRHRLKRKRSPGSTNI